MSETLRLTGLVGFSGMKVPVAVCATANVTLSGEQTIDGVTTDESRILLTGQTDQTENGIWITDTGDWARAQDCDGPYDLRQGTVVNAYGGTSNSGFWVCTTANDVDIGTDNITFIRSSTTLAAISAFWQGVLATANAAAARTSLGTPGLTGNETIAGDKTFSGASTFSGATTHSGLVTMSGKSIIQAEGAAVASAVGAIDIWATDGDTIHITGNTGPITSFGTAPQAGAWKKLIFDSTPTLTQSASLNLNNGGSDITIEAGDVALVYADTTTQIDVFVIRKSGAAVATTAVTVFNPRGYIDGCVLSNNAGDATNDIDIAAGVCRDSTNAFNITVAALTKRLDANWAAGTNQGMRYSGAAIANTTYGIWAAAKADGTQDIYAYPNSGAPSAATVLAALQAESGGADYAYVRRIGCIIRESAAIVPFVQDGDEFMRKTAVLTINSTSSAAGDTTITLAVPLGVRVKAHIAAWHLGGDDARDRYFSDLSRTAMTALIRAGAPTASLRASTNATFSIWTNTSGQIRSNCSGTGTGTYEMQVSDHGWTDLRGKDA